MPIFALTDLCMLTFGMSVEETVALHPDSSYRVIQNILMRGAVHYKEDFGTMINKHSGWVSAIRSFEKQRRSPEPIPSTLRRILVADGVHAHIRQIHVEIDHDPWAMSTLKEAVKFMDGPVFGVPDPSIFPEKTYAAFLLYDAGNAPRKLLVYPMPSLLLLPDEREDRFQAIAKVRNFNKIVMKTHKNRFGHTDPPCDPSFTARPNAGFVEGYELSVEKPPVPWTVTYDEHWEPSRPEVGRPADEPRVLPAGEPSVPLDNEADRHSDHYGDFDNSVDYS